MNQDKIKNIETALRSWEEGLPLLGNCIVQFQWIERVLADCIVAMINCDNDIGDIVTSGMSFKAKTTIYRALFIHLSNRDELPDDIKELVKRISWADEERNKLVHSIWNPSEENPETILRQKTVCRKKGLITQEEYYRPEDLDDLSKLYEGISTDLIYLTQKFLPSINIDK